MGFFSWITQDTSRSISNTYSSIRPRTVYMIDNAGNQYREDNYEGYGEFGGKDFYQLVAEMNMVDPALHTRDVGINLEFNIDKVVGDRKHPYVIWPTLVDNPRTGWLNACPESCPDQGFFYSEDNGDDYDY